MTIWMGDCPRENVSKKKWFAFFDTYDIHKWVIGREEGKHGYKHWQFRFETSQFDGTYIKDDGEIEERFEILKSWFKQAHFEKASDSWSYETKSGNYFRSDDTPRILRQRFGPFTEAQERVLQTVRRTNDREIVVWYTPEGNVGKTWFRKALWERRIAHFVNPVKISADKMVQDCASEFIRHGTREIIVIDLPRTYRWDMDTYIAVEMVKDGLVKDLRYSSESVNMDVGVLVLCNEKPRKSALSTDRWVVLDRDGRPVLL